MYICDNFKKNMGKHHVEYGFAQCSLVEQC